MIPAPSPIPLTHAQAVAIADEQIADIDATIAHWRDLGVQAECIGTALKCHHKWAAIRRKMIVIATPPREMPAEAALIALIGSRKRRRLTQQQVADRMGISRRRISHYESGVRTPPAETLAAWRAELGLRPRAVKAA